MICRWCKGDIYKHGQYWLNALRGSLCTSTSGHEPSSDPFTRADTQIHTVGFKPLMNKTEPSSAPVSQEPSDRSSLVNHGNPWGVSMKDRKPASQEHSEQCACEDCTGRNRLVNASQEPKSIDELAQAEMAEGIYDITEAETPRPEMPPPHLKCVCGSYWLMVSASGAIRCAKCGKPMAATVPQEPLREALEKIANSTWADGESKRIALIALKSTAAPRTQPQPKCPKCGSGELTIGDGEISCNQWQCVWVAPLAQFFLPTPPQPWISVKERLPEVQKVSYDDFSESIEVLVMTTLGNRRVAQYTVPKVDPPHWDETDGCTYATDEITHWQPLPTPPEQGQTEEQR